jgi:tetratricopeptide (TPR) repeat protein
MESLKNNENFSESNTLDELKIKLSTLPSFNRFSDEQVELIFSLGSNHFNQGKISLALDFFQILLIYRPLDPRFLFSVGLCLKNLYRYQEAIAPFCAAMGLDENPITAGLHLAECLAALGKVNDAQSLLNPIIDLSKIDNSYDSLVKRAESLKDLLEQT